MIMENNIFEEVLRLLVDVKVQMQKLKGRIQQELVRKVDICISKVAPLADVYASTISKTDKPMLHRDKSISLKEISTFEKTFDIRQANFQQQTQELLKVKRSFIKQEQHQNNTARREIVIDYFVFKYDFKLKQYIILGRHGGQKSDRRVFLDLFTDDRRGGLRKIEKTESMTNILKAVYNPGKIGEPFVLPNCQEEQIKYLFLFSLNECGCDEKDFYQSDTLYCFITREFILGELTNLMDSIASIFQQYEEICFERRVNEITPNEERLHEIVERLNAKKTYLAIQEGIQNFLRNLQSYQAPNLTVSKMERWKSNTYDRYLERSSLKWSLFKRVKPKEQKCCLTLVLLFYFAISEYKIIILAQQQNKHTISQLIIGLLTSLEPLTFIYPIVAATITPHHMQFTNSPVPLLLGLWGSQEYHAVAKSSLKKLLKQQRELSKEELQRQTPMVVLDLEDHTLALLDHFSKDLFSIIDKMQNFVEMRYDGPVSQKLGSFLGDLIGEKENRLPDWAVEVRKLLQNTQMYEYYTNRDHA